MSVANGAIAAPISASDPYYAMGIGQYNGTYDIGWACSNNHGKINPYSMYKPIRNPKLTELSYADFKNANFGINPNRINTSNLIQSAKYDTIGYEPPIGGDSSPYRLNDFINYNHSASSQYDIEFPDVTYNQGSGNFVSIYFREVDDVLNMLTISDIFGRQGIDLKSIYLAVIIYHKDYPTRLYIKTDNTPAYLGGNRIISGRNPIFTAGNCEAILCISDSLIEGDFFTDVGGSTRILYTYPDDKIRFASYININGNAPTPPKPAWFDADVNTWSLKNIAYNAVAFSVTVKNIDSTSYNRGFTAADCWYSMRVRYKDGTEIRVSRRPVIDILINGSDLSRITVDYPNSFVLSCRVVIPGNPLNDSYEADLILYHNQKDQQDINDEKNWRGLGAIRYEYI